MRRTEIESGMSRCLVDRLLANPKITVRAGTEVTRIDGEHVLESIALGRATLPFETSVPGVFAVGDVRHGSMKRVAEPELS